MGKVKLYATLGSLYNEKNIAFVMSHEIYMPSGRGATEEMA